MSVNKKVVSGPCSVASRRWAGPKPAFFNPVRDGYLVRANTPAPALCCIFLTHPSTSDPLPRPNPTHLPQILDGPIFGVCYEHETRIGGVSRLYRGRADAENRIKGSKHEFEFDSFNLKGLYATETALIFAMIAYDLMSLFRTFVLTEKTQKRLSTLRNRAFAIGAYFEEINGKLVLKIALNKKRRAWLNGLWNYLKVFEYPFVFSNA